MSLKLIDREEKKGLAKLWENIDIWWYCHVTDKYRSVCCWFRICCNKRRWKLVKQAAFHTYPFSYEYFYNLQKTYMEELIAHYKHGYFATAETYEPIVRWIKMAVKLHDIMLDNNVDLFDYEGEMEFVPIDDGKFYKLKDDNVKYRCLVKVNMRNLDRYLKLSHNQKAKDWYIEHPHELYQLKAWYLYHKLLTMHKRGGTKPILFLSEYRKVIRPMGIQLYNQKVYSCTTKRCIVVQLKGI